MCSFLKRLFKRSSNITKGKVWVNGVFGAVVGDALGVPVEFKSSETLAADPVVGMREFGSHNQPKGTWSDDSSMMLATLDSIRIKGKIDYKDIMDRFKAWAMDGAYTPFDKVFDIGIATSNAISRYVNGEEALKCGGTAEKDNGNGSLMRILPACIYMYEKQKKEGISDDEIIDTIHNVSGLTHAHLRSKIGCGIYFFLVKAIIEKQGSLNECIQSGIDEAYAFYRKDEGNLAELSNYDRLTDLAALRDAPVDTIMSGGYIIETIEAAVWSLITTSSYKDALLKAVNRGHDTDTVAIVAGGLAGLYYGYDGIPADWIEVIQKKEWIESLVR